LFLCKTLDSLFISLQLLNFPLSTVIPFHCFIFLQRLKPKTSSSFCCSAKLLDSLFEWHFIILFSTTFKPNLLSRSLDAVSLLYHFIVLFYRFLFVFLQLLIFFIINCYTISSFRFMQNFRFPFRFSTTFKFSIINCYTILLLYL
jgi:hypothetical protein